MWPRRYRDAWGRISPVAVHIDLVWDCMNLLNLTGREFHSDPAEVLSHPVDLGGTRDLPP